MNRWTALFIGAISAAFSLITPAQAEPAPLLTEAQKRLIDMKLDYDFYLAGLPVAEGKLVALIDSETYSAKTKLETVGLVGLFFDTKVESHVNGERFAGNNLLPNLFEMSSTTKDEDFWMRMPFQDAAPSDVQADPPFKRKSYEIRAEDQQGALDPITGIVAAVLPASAENLCRRVIPIFDGRRRYDVAFIGEVRRHVRDGRNMIDCEGVYSRVAGFKPKMMKKPNYPFKIRFSLEDDGSARMVRIWGETNFGAAVALLRR